MGNLESSTNRPHLHVLDCDRELEYLDGTHQTQGQHVQVHKEKLKPANLT